MKTKLSTILALGAVIVNTNFANSINVYPTQKENLFTRTSISCIEIKEDETSTNNALHSEKPKWKLEYSVTFQTGHNYSGCNGTGEQCFGAGMMWYPCHIPCWGAGTECSHTVTVTLEFRTINNDGGYTYSGTMNTELDGFNGNYLAMPARSILVNDVENGKYMNIPQQNVAIVGTPTYIYNIRGITFSEKPLFSNQ